MFMYTRDIIVMHAPTGLLRQEGGQSHGGQRRNRRWGGLPQRREDVGEYRTDIPI